VEAWAPNRETCIAEAVLGTVAAFVDASSAAVAGSRRFRLNGSSDEDLLVAVLDEVIFLMDTFQQVPIDLEVQLLDAGVDVRFDLVALSALPQVGAVPKGVSLYELRFGPDRRGWSCSVTLDV
jgi:SHS2 domain-containing protein